MSFINSNFKLIGTVVKHKKSLSIGTKRIKIGNIAPNTSHPTQVCMIIIHTISLALGSPYECYGLVQYECSPLTLTMYLGTH